MKIKIEEVSKLDCFLYGVGLGSMAAFAILQIWSAAIVIVICMGAYTFLFVWGHILLERKYTKKEKTSVKGKGKGVKKRPLVDSGGLSLLSYLREKEFDDLLLWHPPKKVSVTIK